MLLKYICYDFGEAKNHCKGMYNGAILGVTRRINDEVEERELVSTHKHEQAMILQQMHMHYTKDYTLRLRKCSGADEEAKGVASGTADSETPDG